MIRPILFLLLGPLAITWALAKPLNVLFIAADDMNCDLGAYGNPQVKTPHLDHMARSGTRFRACITPNLVCQPARASILTGLLPRTHGVRDNGIDLPKETGQLGITQFIRVPKQMSLANRIEPGPGLLECRQHTVYRTRHVFNLLNAPFQNVLAIL